MYTLMNNVLCHQLAKLVPMHKRQNQYFNPSTPASKRKAPYLEGVQDMKEDQSEEYLLRLLKSQILKFEPQQLWRVLTSQMVCSQRLPILAYIRTPVRIPVT